MRFALLALLLAGCSGPVLRPATCIDDEALALYVSVQTAVAADDWLGRLQQLSHANQDATDEAVSRALHIDQAMASGGDVAAALRVQRERQWLAHHPPKG